MTNSDEERLLLNQSVGEHSQAIGYQNNLGLMDSEVNLFEKRIQEQKEQYEARLQEKDKQITYLQQMVERLLKH